VPDPGQQPPSLAAISDVSTIPYRVGLLETAVIGHGTRLDSLEDWRAELRGAFRLVTLTLGASILSSVVAVVSLLALVSGAREVTRTNATGSHTHRG